MIGIVLAIGALGLATFFVTRQPSAASSASATAEPSSTAVVTPTGGADLSDELAKGSLKALDFESYGPTSDRAYYKWKEGDSEALKGASVDFNTYLQAMRNEYYYLVSQQPTAQKTTTVVK